MQTTGIQKRTDCATTAGFSPSRICQGLHVYCVAFRHTHGTVLLELKRRTVCQSTSEKMQHGSLEWLCPWLARQGNFLYLAHCVFRQMAMLCNCASERLLVQIRHREVNKASSASSEYVPNNKGWMDQSAGKNGFYETVS